MMFIPILANSKYIKPQNVMSITAPQGDLFDDGRYCGTNTDTLCIVEVEKGDTTDAL